MAGSGALGSASAKGGSAINLPFLQRAKEPPLRGKREVAHLVEKDGAELRGLGWPRARALCCTTRALGLVGDHPSSFFFSDGVRFETGPGAISDVVCGV